MSFAQESINIHMKMQKEKQKSLIINPIGNFVSNPNIQVSNFFDNFSCFNLLMFLFKNDGDSFREKSHVFLGRGSYLLT